MMVGHGWRGGIAGSDRGGSHRRRRLAERLLLMVPTSHLTRVSAQMTEVGSHAAHAVASCPTGRSATTDLWEVHDDVCAHTVLPVRRRPVLLDRARGG